VGISDHDEIFLAACLRNFEPNHTITSGPVQRFNTRLALRCVSRSHQCETST